MTITVALSVLLGLALTWLVAIFVRDAVFKRRAARKAKAEKEASESLASLLRASGYSHIADALMGELPSRPLPQLQPPPSASVRPTVDPTKLATYLRSGLTSGGVTAKGSALDSAATSAPPSIDAWAAAVNTAVAPTRPTTPTQDDIDQAVTAIERTAKQGVAPAPVSATALEDNDVVAEDVPPPMANPVPPTAPKSAVTAELPAPEPTPAASTVEENQSAPAASTVEEEPTPTAQGPATSADNDTEPDDADDPVIDDADDDLVARLRASATKASAAQADVQTWPGAGKGTRQVASTPSRADADVRKPRVRSWTPTDDDHEQGSAPASPRAGTRDDLVESVVVSRPEDEPVEAGFRRWFSDDEHTPSTVTPAVPAASAPPVAAPVVTPRPTKAPTGTRPTGTPPPAAPRSTPKPQHKPRSTSGAHTPKDPKTANETSHRPAQTPPRRASATGVGTGATPVLALGGLGADGTYRHQGTYATVGLVTTGFSAAHDRIVEIAVVLTDQFGKVVDEYATVVNPGERDLGATFLHGVNPQDVHDAPTFPQIADDVVALLEGAVVVAHHAEFVERFLSAELLRAGILAPTMPGLCTFRLSQQTIRTPNHRLGTIARHLTLPEAAGESALGDARIVATLLPLLIDQFGSHLSYPVAPAEGEGISGFAITPPRPRTGKRAKRAGHHSWIATLMTRLPMSAQEVHDPVAAAYLEALTTVLSEGRVVRDEVLVLGGLLSRTGASARHIHGVSERLLESMRAAACTGKPHTVEELRHLRAAAASLSMPTYFDDLIPEQPALPPGRGSFARPVRKPKPPEPPKQGPRCAHCLRQGHYSPECPTLGLGSGPAELTSGVAAASRQGQAAAQAAATVAPDGSPDAPYDATIVSVSSASSPDPAAGRARTVGLSPWQSVTTRTGTGTGPVGAVTGVDASDTTPAVVTTQGGMSSSNAAAWAEAVRRHPGAAGAAHLTHGARQQSAYPAPDQGEDTAQISRLARLAAPPPVAPEPDEPSTPTAVQLPGLIINPKDEDDKNWY